MRTKRLSWAFESLRGNDDAILVGTWWTPSGYPVAIACVGIQRRQGVSAWHPALAFTPLPRPHLNADALEAAYGRDEVPAFLQNAVPDSWGPMFGETNEGTWLRPEDAWRESQLALAMADGVPPPRRVIQAKSPTRLVPECELSATSSRNHRAQKRRWITQAQQHQLPEGYGWGAAANMLFGRAEARNALPNPKGKLRPAEEAALPPSPEAQRRAATAVATLVKNAPWLLANPALGYMATHLLAASGRAPQAGHAQCWKCTARELTSSLSGLERTRERDRSLGIRQEAAYEQLVGAGHPQLEVAQRVMGSAKALTWSTPGPHKRDAARWSEYLSRGAFPALVPVWRCPLPNRPSAETLAVWLAGPGGRELDFLLLGVQRGRFRLGARTGALKTPQLAFLSDREGWRLEEYRVAEAPWVRWTIGWNGASSSNTICSHNSTNKVVTCDLTASGTSMGATFYAAYDTTYTTCAYEYCFWGTDEAGNAFCLEHQLTGPSTNVTGVDVLGGPHADSINFIYTSGSVWLLPHGGLNMTARAFGYGDNDTILGTPYAGSDYTELFWGGDDSDTLDGDKGVDQLFGEAGVDYLYGGDGADVLRGGDNDDELYGEGHADSCYGEGGIDIIDGGTDNDTISGGDGGDIIVGGPGNDIIGGDDGADDILGESGADTISGGDEGDIVGGGDGNDTIYGDAGDDDLAGGNDNDTIHGDGGADQVCGDAGTDSLTGDANDDNLFGAAAGGESMNGGSEDASDACEAFGGGTRTGCEAVLGARTCTY